MQGLTEMSEAEYRKHPNISQSFLKCVLKDDFTQPKRDVTMKGSVVDTLLFGQPFDDFYIEKDIHIPDPYFSIFKRLKYPFTEEDIYREIAKLNYQPNWKPETHIAKIRPYLRDYGEIAHEKREVVSTNFLKECKIIVEDIKSSEHWNKLNHDGALYQPKFFSKLLDLDVKGMLDFYQPKDTTIVDLKVTENKIADFFNVAKTLKYPFQMSFYRDLVLSTDHSIKPSDLKCYWLVYSQLEKRCALIRCSKEDLDVGKFGNKYNQGYQEAILVYQTCKNKETFNYKHETTNGFFESEIY